MIAYPRALTPFGRALRVHGLRSTCLTAWNVKSWSTDLVPCIGGEEAHFALAGKVCGSRACIGRLGVHIRTGETTRVVGTGVAVCPITLRSYGARLSVQPIRTIAPAFDGLK